MNEGTKSALIAVPLGLIIAVAAAGGYFLGQPKQIVETAKPAEVQKDGSQVVERKADAKAKPKHMIPKGAKVDRIEQIVAQGATPDEIKACTDVPCPSVTVDLTVVTMDDGTKRVVASSPNGSILSAVDIAVAKAVLIEPKPWAAGVSADPIKQTLGVWVERDIGRVRLGIDLNQTRPTPFSMALEGRVRLGMTF